MLKANYIRGTAPHPSIVICRSGSQAVAVLRDKVNFSRYVSRSFLAIVKSGQLRGITDTDIRYS